MRLNNLAGPGLIFAVLGSIFLIIGLVIVNDSFEINQELDQIETLPLLNTPHLSDTKAGTEAVFEGQIAERNALDRNGFVAYVRYEYQGERCTSDEDGVDDCEAVWVEDKRHTPDLWLDMDGGRARVVNVDYDILNAPVLWQSMETLVEQETVEYHAFKIGDPLFSRGVVALGTEEPAFFAEFIYGGNRENYLADQRNGANSTYWIGLAISSFGGLFVAIGVGVIAYGVFG